MADIFISYKREDQEQKGRIIPIVRALEAEGFDVFYDVEIPPGSTWEKVLQTKINMAKCVLVMWSESSVASDWVKEEAEIAKSAGKFIPVFLDVVNAPFGFSRIEGANLVGWTGDLENKEWKNLVAAIKSKVGEGAGTPRPEVKSVPMPVERPRKAGGGVSRLALLGLLVFVLGGAGYFGMSMLNQPTSKEPEVDQTKSAEAKKMREKQAFEKAMSANSVQTWDRFIETYPDSEYIKEAWSYRQKLIEETKFRPVPTPSPSEKPAPTPTPTMTLVPTPQPTARPQLLAKEDCLTYSGQYRVESLNGAARLVDASGRGVPVYVAGTNADAEIKSAYEITQNYKLLSQCFVDRPNPPFKYWKTTAGDIPAGAMRGEDCLPVDLKSLSAKVRGGMYYVYSGNSTLMRFDDQDSANQAVNILQHYGATHMCYVGRPDPSLMYIRK